MSANVLPRRGEYNVALTGAAFVDADTSCSPRTGRQAVAAGRRLVDEQTNCEDILMNYVAGNAHAPGLSFAALLPLPLASLDPQRQMCSINR